MRETPSGEVRVLPHAEKAHDEAEAKSIIDRITSQIEEGSFQPRGTDLDLAEELHQPSPHGPSD